MPRIHCPQALAPDLTLDLPATAARHVQVLRLQPGDALTLFDGRGGQWAAEVVRMGRSDVTVRTLTFENVERESERAVRIAVGMPANDRMDWLVEKATELGVAEIQPLVTSHSVVRLAGERAEKKQAHWQAVAVAACEQCGRNRVPSVGAPLAFSSWLAGSGHEGALRLVLAPGAQAPLAQRVRQADSVWMLIGPEGGWAASELTDARARGFEPASLGPRVLRTDTAVLAALAALA